MDWWDVLKVALPLLFSLFAASVVAFFDSGLRFVGRFLGGGAKRDARAAGETLTLRYAGNIRAGFYLFGLFMAVLGCSLIQNGRETADQDLKVAYIAVGGVMVLLLPVAALEVTRHKIVVTPEGVSQTSLVRWRPVRIAWGEMISVAPGVVREHYYRIRSADGKTIEVDSSLDGFALFVQACRQRLAPAVFAKTSWERGASVDEAMRDSPPPT